MRALSYIIAVTAVALLGWGSLAAAFPVYLDAWVVFYPTSTLPQRMSEQTAAQCHVCHHPPTRDLPGNCYRADLIDRLALGMSIEDAIADLDGVDSDGDGIPNGVEILFARPDLPGERGYNPGLRGPVGRDPCSNTPNQAVTNQRETPCPGDADGDARVDQDDIDLVLFNFGTAQLAGTQGDLDGNGVVDQDDIDIVLFEYGRVCP